jgi:hypothetical protein
LWRNYLRLSLLRHLFVVIASWHAQALDFVAFALFCLLSLGLFDFKNFSWSELILFGDLLPLDVVENFLSVTEWSVVNASVGFQTNWV